MHILLYAQIKHSLFFTIFHTGNSGKIALSSISLNPVNNINRNILHSHILVISKIFLTIYKNSCYRLTINRYCAILVYLHTRQTLYKIFKYRTIRYFKSIHIVHKGIVNHLCRWQCILNNSFAQHNGIVLHFNHTQRFLSVIFYYFQIQILSLIANK